MLKSRLEKIIDGCRERVPRSEGLVPAVLAGGPGHRGRAIVFLFPESSRVPEFVVKIALVKREGQYLTQEYRALESVHAALPHALTTRIPKALALIEIEEIRGLVCKALIGQRLLVPKLTSKHSVIGRRVLKMFFQQTFRFSQDLAQGALATNASFPTSLPEIVSTFIDQFGGQGEASRELEAFKREILNTQISAKPAWQHCDMMISNVLQARGELRVLDWEHSRPNSRPWFDIAYAPIALALTSSWQAGRKVQEVIRQVLNKESWPGRILIDEMERVWKFPIPLSWGVLLTAMETALRQKVEDRTASSDWSGFVHTVLAKNGKQELPWLSRW